MKIQSKMIVLILFLFNCIKASIDGEVNIYNITNGQSIQADLDKKEDQDILYFSVKVNGNYANKYLKVTITEKKSKLLNNTNETLDHILSLYKDDQFSQRTQIVQGPSSKTEMWLNEKQIGKEFYFTVATVNNTIRLEITEQDSLEITFGDSYSYYVTEETKEMNFNIKKDEYQISQEKNINNTLLVYAKGYNTINSNLNVTYKDKHSKYNAYIIDNNVIQNNSNIDFNVKGEIGDLISVGVVFFDGKESIATNNLDGKSFGFSGFLKKNVIEHNCWKIKKNARFSVNSVFTYDNLDNNIGIEETDINNDYVKRCIIMSDNIDELFYSLQFFKDDDKENKKTINYFSPQILGYNSYYDIVDKKQIELIPYLTNLDFDSLTYHINVLNEGKMKAYIYTCNNYPDCKFDETFSYQIEDLGSFHYTVHKEGLKDFSTSMTNKKQKMLLIKCLDEEECLISVNIYTNKDLIYISPEITDYRYLQTANQEKYLIGNKGAEIGFYLTIEIFSGNVDITTDSKNLKEYSEKNKHLYIINDKEVALTINAKNTSFYSINYMTKTADALYSYTITSSGNYLFNLDKNSNQGIGFEFSKNDPQSKNYLFVGFYPINCDITIDSKKIGDFYQKMYTLSQNQIVQPRFNITNEDQNKDCLFYTSTYLLNNNLQDINKGILLANAFPQSFQFTREYPVLKFIYGVSDPEYDLKMEINTLNETDHNLAFFINKQEIDALIFNTNQTIQVKSDDIKSKCKNGQTCRLSIVINAPINKKDDKRFINIKVSQDEENGSNKKNDNENNNTTNKKYIITIITLSIIIIVIVVVLTIIICLMKGRNEDLLKKVNNISFAGGDEKKEQEQDEKLIY